MRKSGEVRESVEVRVGRGTQAPIRMGEETLVIAVDFVGRGRSELVWLRLVGERT